MTSVFNMRFRDIAAKEAAESVISFDGQIVYPIDNESAEATIITIKNALLSDNFISFDLDLSQVRAKDLKNSYVKVVLGTRDTLAKLETRDFPQILKDTTRDILFSDKGRKNIYKSKKEIKNVRLDFDEAGLLEGTIKIFITLVVAPRVWIVNYFDINKNDISFESAPTTFEPTTELLPTAGKEISPVLTTATSILSRDIFVSDLHYSYSTNDVFSGFYSIDAQKFINEFAKFPHLLDSSDQDSFSSFLFKTEASLLKYEKQNYGYHFDNIYGPVNASRVENIIVNNSSGKFFYDFAFSDISSMAQYQVKLVFNFIDTTINIMKDVIDVLTQALIDNDRDEARTLIIEAYGNKIPNEYRNSLQEIDILSDASFAMFVNKIISNLQTQVDSAQEKSVSNQHVKSQYMFPSPSIPNLAISTFEKKFSKVITLKQEKQNNIISFTGGGFFNEVFSRSVLNSINLNEILEVTSKSFQKVAELKSISSFSATSIIDKTTASSNLETNLKIGMLKDKMDEKLSIVEPEKFIKLTTTTKRQVKFLYLDSVGDSASALIFREVDSEFISSIGNNSKVLVRMDTPEEFFDSYFYVVGDNFEAGR